MDLGDGHDVSRNLSRAALRRRHPRSGDLLGMGCRRRLGPQPASAPGARSPDWEGLVRPRTSLPHRRRSGRRRDRLSNVSSVAASPARHRAGMGQPAFRRSATALRARTPLRLAAASPVTPSGRSPPPSTSTRAATARPAWSSGPSPPSTSSSVRMPSSEPSPRSTCAKTRQQKFVDDFVAARDNVMNLDRFDLA